MAAVPFIKMHGAGNDFVVIDNRSGAFALDEAARIRLADRRYGVGCDQIVLLEDSHVATAFMRLYNADGGEVGACGNATRCVAWLLMEETGEREVEVETRSGVLTCKRAGDTMVQVDMGAPRFGWKQIPLAQEVDVVHVPLHLGELDMPVALSMGNPHAVFFVPDVERLPLDRLGPKLEHDPLFPERANIGASQVVDRSFIKLRVWERGAGLTLACGTGACAAMVAARLRGLVDSAVKVQLPGGVLYIDWNGTDIHDAGSVLMTGPVAVVFKGSWE